MKQFFEEPKLHMEQFTIADSVLTLSGVGRGDGDELKLWAIDGPAIEEG